MNAAPADARPHRRWSAWQIVLAYLILAAPAAGAIWVVDRDAAAVDLTPAVPASVP